ncbi:hypothetical protein HDU89_000522 [Geranomyces variabilis]|nr:hypothetical protein HDU89_000522 [Geranomyces variabilis]
MDTDRKRRVGNASDINVPRSRNKKEHPIVEAAFSLLYAMTQGNHIHPTLGFVIQIIEDVQLLAFSFRPAYGFASMPSWMPLVFNVMSAKPSTHSASRALFYIAFVVSFTSLLLTIVVGTSMKGSQMKVVWPLQVLRLLTTLISTVLLIPMMEIFLTAISCHDSERDVTWLKDDPSQCFTAQFLPQFVLGIAGVFYLILQAPLMASVFFTIHPGNSDPHSKTTGRIDAVYNMSRLVLAILLGLLEYKPVPLLICVILLSGAQQYLITRYQPFFVGPMNDLRSAIFCSSMVSGLQALIVYGSPRTDSAAPFATMCVLLVPSFLTGFFVCRRTRVLLAQGVYKRLREQKTQNAANKLNSNFSSRPTVSRSTSFHKVRSSSVRHSASQSLTPSGDGLDLEGNMMENMDSIVKKHMVEPIEVFGIVADVELACRFLQHNTDPEARYLANTIFSAGLEQFPKSATLHLLRAHYVATYHLASFDEIWHSLEQAKALKPPFDTRFSIFFEECAVEQERRKEDLLASSLNVAGYAEFNHMEADAQRYHLQTLIAIKALWQYMRNEKQASGSLPYLLEEIGHNKYMAIRLYKKILSKYPRSKQTLRRYSNFLLRATDATEEAKKMLSRAEEIENDEARYGSLAAAALDEEQGGSYPTAEDYNKRDEDSRPPRSADNHHHPRVTVYAPGESLPRIDSFQPDTDNDIPPMSEVGPYVKASAIATSDDDIAVGEDAGTRRRRTRRESLPGGTGGDGSQRKISFAQKGEAPASPMLQVAEEVIIRKKGGSIVPSSVSSQREARQQRFLKEAITRRLRAPIARFQIFMNVGLAGTLAILAAGCALGMLAYNNVTKSLAEAYARSRPRNTAMRVTKHLREMDSIVRGRLATSNPAQAFAKTLDDFLQQINTVWAPVLLPLLQTYHLNDNPNIVMLVQRGPMAVFETFNPFSLGEAIRDRSGSIANTSMADIPASTDTTFFVKNVIAVANAYDATSKMGITDFLSSISTNTTSMIGLLVALPLSCLLLGYFFFRPMVERVYQKQVLILSLLNGVSKKYVTEMIEGFEIEIENIMEELDESSASAKLSASASSSLPPDSVMIRHGPKRQLKMIVACFLLFATPGTLMFVPALQQSAFAKQAAQTIRGLSDRNFDITMATLFAVEVAANDMTTWLPGIPNLWLQHYTDKFDYDDQWLMTDTSESPSLFQFPSVQGLLRVNGNCLSSVTNGCDPSVRAYNESIGLTYQLVTGPYQSLTYTWHEAVKQYISALPQNQNFDNGNLILIRSILDDISSGAKAVNDLLVADITSRNNSAKAFTLLAFSISVTVWAISYLVVHRRLISMFTEQVGGCLWLVFSLPPEITSALPDLKRFVESGGALLPGQNKS